MVRSSRSQDIVAMLVVLMFVLNASAGKQSLADLTHPLNEFSNDASTIFTRISGLTTVSMIVSNGATVTWTTELENKTSPLYQETLNAFQAELEAIYTDAGIPYVNLTVIRLRKGTGVHARNGEPIASEYDVPAMAATYSKEANGATDDEILIKMQDEVEQKVKDATSVRLESGTSSFEGAATSIVEVGVDVRRLLEVPAEETTVAPVPGADWSTPPVPLEETTAHEIGHFETTVFGYEEWSTKATSNDVADSPTKTEPVVKTSTLGHHHPTTAVGAVDTTPSGGEITNPVATSVTDDSLETTSRKKTSIPPYLETTSPPISFNGRPSTSTSRTAATSDTTVDSLSTAESTIGLHEGTTAADVVATERVTEDSLETTSQENLSTPPSSERASTSTSRTAATSDTIVDSLSTAESTLGLHEGTTSAGVVATERVTEDSLETTSQENLFTPPSSETPRTSASPSSLETTAVTTHTTTPLVAETEIQLTTSVTHAPSLSTMPPTPDPDVPASVISTKISGSMAVSEIVVNGTTVRWSTELEKTTSPLYRDTVNTFQAELEAIYRDAGIAYTSLAVTVLKRGGAAYQRHGRVLKNDPIVSDYDVELTPIYSSEASAATDDQISAKIQAEVEQQVNYTMLTRMASENSSFVGSATSVVQVDVDVKRPTPGFSDGELAAIIVCCFIGGVSIVIFAGYVVMRLFVKGGQSGEGSAEVAADPPVSESSQSSLDESLPRPPMPRVKVMETPQQQMLPRHQLSPVDSLPGRHDGNHSSVTEDDQNT